MEDYRMRAASRLKSNGSMSNEHWTLSIEHSEHPLFDVRS
jgi:hypothetical protein